jgi:MoaA/NifB/PqqE/SkfB family radical SAM enzyme
MLDYQMYKVAGRWPHQDSIKIEWNLGKRCNYDCSYCPESIHDNSSKHTDIEILKKVIDKLTTLGKKIRLSFTGGEPTVHPKFEELLHYCRKSNIDWISVTTNGTRKAAWYLKQPVDQWVYSLHFETDDWHRIVNTIINVNTHWKNSILVNVMAHHLHMEEVKNAAEQLQLDNIPIGIRRIRWTAGDHDIFDDNKYDLADLEWISKSYSTVKPNVIIDDREPLHSNDIIKLHLNKFNGWTCNVGIESLMINWDGEVHRATCRVGGSLGNIHDDTFNNPNNAIICTRSWCTCAADIPITKFK